MPRPNRSLLACSLLILSLAGPPHAAAGEEAIRSAVSDDLAPLLLVPAQKRPHASQEMLLAAARAGDRLVVVGDRGVILLSDDAGRTYRQARGVPVRSTLTAVSFADEKHGWAVGHAGVILNTGDGGETWTLQRSDLKEDRPLFAVHFSDAQHGVAAGLWSLLLVTGDGGRNWKPVTLSAPPEGGRADRNLYGMFADAKGTLFIAAERGTVLRSADQGRNWTYLATGYNGSFWNGCALKDGTLLVAGLRGTIYRSGDGGHSWQAAATDTRNSITQIAEVDGKVVAVGLNGVQLTSTDRGVTFAARLREDSLVLTALSEVAGKVQIYSKRGVVADADATTTTASK